LSQRTLTAAILDCISAIPPGYVMSYGDVAACAGATSPRQVGSLLASTDHAVPWHRVVRADGSLAAPDHERQRQMLSAEGVRFRGTRVDMASCRHSVAPAG
jgi:methylated-DNA-protein-cysteine methyltransferase-like protein